MIWAAPRSWPGETCVILAGGPSLKGFDARSILRPERKHQPFENDPLPRVIAINDSWRIAPWADAFYATDPAWFHQQIQLNRQSLDGAASFGRLLNAGLWICGTQAHDFDDHSRINVLRLSGQLGLEQDPRALKHGSNSGYAAINLAYHFGARRILLLGYDMHCDGDVTHWHDEERAPAGRFGMTLERSMLPCFRFLAPPLRVAGIEVINCTPGSALTQWPYMPIEEALAQSTASPA